MAIANKVMMGDGVPNGVDVDVGFVVAIGEGVNAATRVCSDFWPTAVKVGAAVSSFARRASRVPTTLVSSKSGDWVGVAKTLTPHPVRSEAVKMATISNDLRFDECIKIFMRRVYHMPGLSRQQTLSNH